MKFFVSLAAFTLLACGGADRGGTPSLPQAVVVPRATGHTATLLADGTVLVAGGIQADGKGSATAERIDPVAMRSVAVGDMAGRRIRHTATLLPSGKVLLAGGAPWDGTAIALATAELFDPATGRFSPTKNTMTCARHSHTATLLPDGTVLLAGGDAADGDGVWRTAEVFDPVTGTFQPLDALMTAFRTLHTASLMDFGQVLIVGGTTWIEDVATAEFYDPATRKFTALATTPDLAFVGHSAQRLDSGAILLVGNWGTEVFDPLTWIFAPVPGPSLPRNYAALVPVKGIGAALLGGEPAPPVIPPTAYATVEVFQTGLNRFRSGSALAAPRSGLQAVVLKDGRILVVGGTDANLQLHTTFEVLAE